MKIEGYEFEITEFDSCGEADEALRIARAEDQPIMGGKVLSLPQQAIGRCVVQLYNDRNETWYL